MALRAHFVSSILVLTLFRVIPSDAQNAIPLSGCGALVGAYSLRPDASTRQDKYFLRVLLSGGPIAQPTSFYRIDPFEPSKIERPEAILHDHSAPPFLEGPRIGIGELVRIILDSPMPLVFKPNQGMQGNRIFFFETHGTDFKVTYSTSYINDNWLNIDGLRAKGYNFITSPSPGAINSLTFPRTELEKPGQLPGGILGEIWNSATVHYWHRFGDRSTPLQLTYDSGMVEKNETGLFRPNGMAYETRFTVARSLTGKTLKVIKHSSARPADNPVGRVGASAYFANYMGREKKASCFRAGRHYNPVFESLNYSAEEKADFEIYVDGLLIQEAQYALKRLAEVGLEPTDNELTLMEFDLLWRMPRENSRYPEPLLCESRINYLKRKPNETEDNKEFEGFIEEQGLE